jgi:hypothetical protein
MARQDHEIFGSMESKIGRARAQRIIKTLYCIATYEQGRNGSYSRLRLRPVNQWRIKENSHHLIASVVSKIVDGSAQSLNKVRQRGVELRRNKQRVKACSIVQKLEVKKRRKPEHEFELARARMILDKPARKSMSSPLQRILDSINERIPEALKKNCLYHWTWTVSSGSEFIGNRLQSKVTWDKVRRLEVVREHGLVEVDISACAWQIGSLVLYGKEIEGDFYSRLAQRVFPGNNHGRDLIKAILTSAMGASCKSKKGIQQCVRRRLRKEKIISDPAAITDALLEDPLVLAWGWQGKYTITTWVESLSNAVLYSELAIRGISGFSVHDAMYVGEKDREVVVDLQMQCLRLAAGIAVNIQNVLQEIEVGTYPSSGIREITRQIVADLPPMIKKGYFGVIGRMFLEAIRIQKIRVSCGCQNPPR